MKPIKKQFIDESPFGVYVWEMPDGRWVGDSEGRFLSIQAKRDDEKRLEELVRAVRSCGVEEGYPVFLAGNRKVTDDEFDEQLQRQEWGLTPDPMDVPALIDEMKAQRGK